MSRDGSGNYGLPAGNPVTTNTVISSTWANTTLSDIAAALTQSLSKDGQTTPTANLSMGNFRLISLAAGTNRTDAVNVGQVQDNTPAVLSSIAGTGDAITAATAPAILTYATDSKFVYTPATTNTLTNPTIAIDGLAAKTITQSNGVGLWSGALVVGTPYELLYDGTNFRAQSGALGGLAVIPQGAPFGFRNKLIDGAFQYFTKATSTALSSSTIAYISDIWGGVAGNASAAATVSQQTFTPGAQPVGTTSPCKLFLLWNQTVASGANPQLFQRIEDSTLFGGQSATFSVWLWTVSGTITIPSVIINQTFQGSTQVSTSFTANWVVTTTPQRFSLRVDVPSVAGKTLGAGDYLTCGFSFPASSTFGCNILQPQFEDCPAGAPATGLPTPFENPDAGITRSRLSRYINFISCSARFPAAAGAQSSAATITYPAMRAAPAATLITAGTPNNLSSQTVGALNANGSLFQIVSTAAGDCSAANYLYMLDARF